MGHDETDQGAESTVSSQSTASTDPVAATKMTRATEHYDDDKIEQPAAGHTWGASVTSLVGPTDETVGVVDADEPRVQRQQAIGEQIEEAIVAVARTHAGTHSREIVRDALRRELEARGRWPQPEPWLDAVATEMEAGGVYTTGTETAGLSGGAASPSP